MRTLVRTLTSRGVSVALMAFIAGSGAIGAWVPQRVNVPPAVFARWQADNPLLSAAASALGLDRLFWSWWFAAILALFTVSLLVATARMTADAWRSTRPSVKAPQSVVVGATVQQVAERARACGYRERASAGDVRVFTRNGLGVWGPALMHAGMVVTVGAALASAAFTSRAVADLSAGEVFLGPEDYLVVDGGVWSTPPDLGRPWRLEGLDTGTWPDGSLKTLSARIGMAGDDGAFEITFTPRRVAPPPPLLLDLRGLEPPQPMLRVLEEVEKLPDGGAIVALTRFRPVHLLEILEERGVLADSSEQPDGSHETIIRMNAGPERDR